MTDIAKLERQGVGLDDVLEVLVEMARGREEVEPQPNKTSANASLHFL